MISKPYQHRTIAGYRFQLSTSKYPPDFKIYGSALDQRWLILALADQAPNTSARVKQLLVDAAGGRMRRAQYADSLWRSLTPIRQEIRAIRRQPISGWQHRMANRSRAKTRRMNSRSP